MSDANAFDPMAELEATQQFQAKARECAAFLAEHGLLLSLPETEPDIDEYIESFVADPPANLAGATTDDIYRAASEAWVQACLLIGQQRVQIASNQIEIQLLAGQFCMIHATSEAGDVAEANKWAKALYLNFYPREPWISLILTEFPELIISSKDIDELEIAPPIIDEKADNRFESLYFEFESFLLDRGIVPQAEDVVVLTQLAASVSISQVIKGGANQAIISRLGAQETIKSTPSAEHPAWQELLGKYFPIPEE